MEKDRKTPEYGDGALIQEPPQVGLSPNEKEEIQNKFDRIDLLVFTVVVVLLVMVATLIIDSFHINSATYKEYSEKTETLDALQAQNAELLRQNREERKFMLDQQKKIIELLQTTR